MTERESEKYALTIASFLPLSSASIGLLIVRIRICTDAHTQCCAGICPTSSAPASRLSSRMTRTGDGLQYCWLVLLRWVQTSRLIVSSTHIKHGSITSATSTMHMCNMHAVRRCGSWWQRTGRYSVSGSDAIHSSDTHIRIRRRCGTVVER